jgi:dTDP-4-amino-4,6-dideoxygalactose transaminase
MQSYRIVRAADMYDRVVNLPCSVSLTEEEITRVVDVIRKET